MPRTARMVVTHAVVHADRREAFDAYTRKLAAALDAGAHDGLVVYSIRRELLGDEAWTCTVWTDDAALERFVRSPLHREAMREAAPALRSIRTRRVDVPVDALPPTWEHALEALEAPDAFVAPDAHPPTARHAEPPVVDAPTAPALEAPPPTAR